MGQVVFEEGTYSCPQKVVDRIQGTSMDDALAIRIAEDLVAKRCGDEIRQEVTEMLSKLTKPDRSKLIGMIVRFPEVSSVELYEQFMEWKASHVETSKE